MKVRDGHLDMKPVLEKFVKFFDDVYGDQGERQSTGKERGSCWKQLYERFEESCSFEKQPPKNNRLRETGSGGCFIM